MTGLRLMLVRHGETDANVKMALDSAPPGPPLNEQGQRQAADLAEALAGEPVVAVYASAAIRAQQTATAVADRHGLAVEILAGVQEVGVGDLEGHTDQDSLRQFFEVFVAWNEGRLDVPMPGGETGQQVLDRYRRVLEDLRARHPHGVVVLVSHGAVIRLVAPNVARNLDFVRSGPVLVPNTGRVVLDDDPDGWRCVEWTGVQLA